MGIMFVDSALSPLQVVRQTIFRRVKKYFRDTSLLDLYMSQLTGKAPCTADSGGYTMKWRRVKPKPWEVRRRRTVLGPGHEKGSSSAEYNEGSAGSPHSAESFYKINDMGKRET